MVGSGVAAFLLGALALLPHGSIAASLTAQNVMRSEHNSVEMKSHGEVIRAGQTPNDGVQMNSAASKYTPEYLQKLATDPVELAKLSTQWCNLSYAMGEDSTAKCAKDEHKIMMDPGMCIEAARQSGAKTSHWNFILQQSTTDRREYKHPAGCFKASCDLQHQGSAHVNGTDSDSGVCYYYNGIGVYPFVPDDDISGTPVCSRAKYLYGKQDEHGSCQDANGVLNDEYEVLDVENKCSIASNCLAIPRGNEFRIGIHNASRHLDFVRGCFVGSDNKMYYNGPNDMGEGTSVTGRNICIVKSTVQWGASTELLNLYEGK